MKNSSKFALRKNEREISVDSSITNATNVSRSSTATEEMKINKLCFHSVGLLDRNKEIQTLRACLNHVIQQEQQTKELGLISGYSGTGKSTLAFSLKKRVNSVKGGGAFVIGKFNQFHSGEPLSAISQAFGELCRKVATEGASLCKEVEAALRAKLHNEVFLLTQIVPELDEIMTSKNQQNETSSDVTSDARQTRLNYAFRVFTRVMCSCFSPLAAIVPMR
eukprot:976831-Ditylum_brightwellii.AAC.1